ncbi:sugar phosphate isomerase/epimerase [bacterium]|nr:sugar phosphate isomerase/epimerase [bacterium]
MRVGACLPWNLSHLLEEAGGDFIELPLREVARLDEEEFNDLFSSLSLPAEAFNIFLPSYIKIVGENVDWEAIEGYLDLSLRRAKLLGGEVIVFGSGGQRRREQDFPQEKAMEQISYFLLKACEVAERFGLKIAIEHLNREETNTINRVSDALQLVEKVGKQNLGVIVDIYHLMKEREGWDVMERAGRKLFHIHISDPQRNPPLCKEGILADFLTFLKKIGYENRISIESRWQNIEEELPKAIENLKSLIEE